MEVDGLRAELKKRIFEDFRRFDPTRADAFSEAAALDKLRNACKVVERLDPVVKEELTDWMADSQVNHTVKEIAENKTLFEFIFSCSLYKRDT